MIALSPDELARYRRHILLDEIGLEGQRKLKSARVLLLGLGGLGSPAALYLAAAGVGTLGLMDFDVVEGHNLQRQIIHDEAAIGRPKTESARRRIEALTPHVRVIEHAEPLTPSNAVETFSAYDIVLDGTDNFSTRYLANDAAILARRPLVYGSIFKFEGSVTVFAPHLGGPCLRCLFPEPPPAGSVPNCGEAGVLGALCGVIGSFQALEVIKLITGLGEPLVGRLLTYDARFPSLQTLRLPRLPDCAACGENAPLTRLYPNRYQVQCEPSAAVPGQSASMSSSSSSAPLEISVEDAHRLLTTRPQTTTLIDVREPFETEICQVPGATLIPMRRIPESLPDLPKDKQLLILCHHGGRSMRVTEYLRQQGLTAVTNVAGGIDAWAQAIDPSLRRY